MEIKRNVSNTYIDTMLRSIFWNARKAFDRVNHVKLFNILINKGLPGRLVKIIIDWYGKTFCVVKGNECFLDHALLKVESAKVGYFFLFFNIYTDVIINTLRSSEYGRYRGRTYVGCTAYADDLILLSASACNLPYVIMLKVGKICKADLEQLQAGNSDIQWFNSMKYLGLLEVLLRKTSHCWP